MEAANLGWTVSLEALTPLSLLWGPLVEWANLYRGEGPTTPGFILSFCGVAYLGYTGWSSVYMIRKVYNENFVS